MSPLSPKRLLFAASLLAAPLLAAGCGGDDKPAGDSDETTPLPVDADGDGWTEDSDCDDAVATVHPGAGEACDGVDNDCDAEIDEAANLTDGASFYADADGDGFGTVLDRVTGCAAPAGYVTDATDCNDAESAQNPAGTERCNQRDDDCDGSIDEEGAADAPTWYIDGDDDGYGDASAPVVGCSAPAGYAGTGGDCDDTDAAYNPGATESDCQDPNDYNCDGSTGYDDLDGDGFPACVECADDNAAANPDAAEACNGYDDNCDGSTDGADAAGATPWYTDADNDGYGDAARPVLSCDAPLGSVEDATDCDDTESAAHPGGTETCDAADNDCDGATDEDVPGSPTWYYDRDSDGAGDPSVSQVACEAPADYVSTGDDCEDNDDSVYPGAEDTEEDGVDNDCDGYVDEGTFTLSSDIQPIFTATCAFSGCHGSSGPTLGLDLSSGAAWSNTVDVPATQLSTMDLIEPGDPDASYLWLKLQGTHSAAGGSGSRMPLTGSISADDLSKIEAWIVDGAPDN